MKHLTVKEKEDLAFEKMKSVFHYKISMASPKLSKIVLNVGTGTLLKKDKNKNDFVSDRLSKITGQKPAPRGAKKSVSSFKIRQGDPIGIVVTLRGKRMYAFIEKLINVALPRTKDFRGLVKKGIDEMGNYSIGIKENTIFPETADEDLKDVFGMTITVGTTATNKKDAEAFLSYIGFPFKKDTVK